MVFFVELWTSSTLGGHDFFKILTIFNAQMHPKKGFKFCLDTKNTKALKMFGHQPIYPIVVTQFVIKE
jgi:hypothetical protein